MILTHEQSKKSSVKIKTIINNMCTYLFAGASSLMARETAKQLKNMGHRVIGISRNTDLTTYDKVYPIENYTFGSFPVIDESINGIVYYPGTINLKPFHRITAAEFLEDYTINTFGAAAFAQSYLNQLKKAENPSIIFMSSVAAQTGMPFHSSIAMAKGAIESLTKSLAAELAPTIRVNCIAPSLTHTPLSEKFTSSPEKLEASKLRNPMRKVGSPEELAQTIFFLLTQGNWITGQVISVDGGMNNIRLI